MPSLTKLKVTAIVTASIVKVYAGPCDIYALGGTPCVAAHGTTRALFDTYSGSLYQLQRADGSLKDITPLFTGGVADTNSHDEFCSGTTCVISTIYDQSGHKNHLTQAPHGRYYYGPQPNGADDLSASAAAPILLNGKKAYGNQTPEESPTQSLGVFIAPGTGYRNIQPNGTATGDQPEGIYAVLDGTHFNDGCCFDYGNAELVNSTAGRDGTMEAIYYGNDTGWGKGQGSGPWIMADLENGLFGGQTFDANNANPSLSYRFVTAAVKGESNHWEIRGGNAESGTLSTFYDGQRPNGYNPMYKEGSVVLGIGGDNSISAQGTWYEGALTYGFPSDAVENQIQSDIVAQKYSTTSMVSGPSVSVGSSISLRATTPGYDTSYIVHSGSTISIQPVSSSSSSTLKGQASFVVRTGLGNSQCVSFESKDTAGSFIVLQSDFSLALATVGSKQDRESATFCPQAGLNGQGNSIRSWNNPLRYFRHYYGKLYGASTFTQGDYNSPSSYNNDVSFVVGNSFA